MKYGAKVDYQSIESAETYEQRSMYNGFVGRRRTQIERKVIYNLAAGIEADSTVLDCPCGNGRWFDALGQKASHIIGVDVSVGMIESAGRRQSEIKAELTTRTGDAEALDLDDGAVEYTFSYALMKHLPLPVQYRVLAEFARVSSKGVFCSFAILSTISYQWWKRRRPAESFPLVYEELEFMAESAGLKLERTVKVSQPLIGLEYFGVFSKL